MGRRIPYRPGPSKAEITAAVNAIEQRQKAQNALITLVVIGVLAFLTVVGGGLLWLMNRQYQKEFGPLVTACERKTVNVVSTYTPTPGSHPAVAVTKSSGHWQLDYPLPVLGSALIPSEAVAPSLAETQLVLCLGPVFEVFIERCPYTTNGADYTNAVERYYLKQEAQLVEAKTGRIVSMETFTGASPRYCQETELVSRNNKTRKLVGTEPSENAVRTWAQAHLIIK